MEVRWSPKAFEDFERIFRRIEADNPAAAREVIKTLYDGCTSLKIFPNVGGLGV